MEKFNLFEQFIMSWDQAMDMFVDICDHNPLYFEGMSATQYDLSQNWNCDVKVNQRLVQFLDQFNSLQYQIRDAITLTEVEDGMAHQQLAISKNFASYPQIQDYLTIKAETLGYNKKQFLLEFYCSSENPFKPFKIQDFQPEEDVNSLCHQICGLDYEPVLFKPNN